MELSFKNWIESALASGIKDTILDFLKDKLNIHDDDEILNMSLKSINPNVVSDLMNRGIIQNSGDSLMNDMKNGSLTVGDLVDRLAGGQDHPRFIPPRASQMPELSV